MSYGSKFPREGAGDDVGKPEDDRGIVFMAFCASLADQFEVIQQWVNGGNSAGGLSAHPDLIAGTFPSESKLDLVCLHENKELRIPIPDEPLVKLDWAVYLFVPSLTAIDYLAGADEPEVVEREVVKRAFGARGGPVTSAVGVCTVLSEHQSFSVREYWKRMESAFGGHYLGMDPEPQILPGDDYAALVQAGDYERESKPTNAYIRGISRCRAFADALPATLAWFETVTPREDGLRIARLDDLAREVIGGIAEKYFGFPEGMAAVEELATTADKARCPVDFENVSALVFEPSPTAATRKQGEERGAVIREKIHAAVDKNTAKREFAQPPRNTASAWIGTINGFSVPTSGSFRSVMDNWMESGELWRIQSWFRSEASGKLPPNPKEEDDLAALKPLEIKLLEAMMAKPVPARLHRVAVCQRELRDGSSFRPGDPVAIDLGAAAREHGEWEILFGDKRGGPHPAHACPGIQMAIGVLLGMIVGTLQQLGLRRNDRLVLELQ